MDKISITEDVIGLRVDKALATILKDESRSHLLKLIEDGCVFVNGQSVKPSYKVQKDDVIEIDFPEPESLDLKAQDLNLNIVYEDSYVAVINKPKGMVVHPGAGVNENTLVNGLLYELDDLSTINGVYRPGIVLRIDKDTSGLLMIAKNYVASK